ncbi:MAG: hypothetical protein RSA70_05690 [Clostridia bacterium]
MEVAELLSIASISIAAGLGLGELVSFIKRGVDTAFNIIKF